jgi:ADP-ribose pyrophosphatase YjhB (NUDIX family)
MNDKTMPDEVANVSSAHIKDFLLAEYRNLADCFWKNEQSGETRVNLFIGLIVAATGGLVTLASAENNLGGEALRLIIRSSLFVLIVLGVVTLFRMLKRNAATDGYKSGCDMVRQLFKDHFDDAHILLRYHPFAPARDESRQNSEYRKIGGLTHTVAAINSVLVAGFAGAVLYPDLSATYIGSAAAFFFAITLQFACVNRSERQAEKRLRAAGPTHAGGLVFRIQDNHVEYLLVGPKKENRDEWLLPKGHIKKRWAEGHGEAALREVREETGVVARLICLAGYVEFDAPKEHVRGKYYLMEPLYETAPTDPRRMAWFGFTDAHAKLTYETDKYLIAAAEKKRAALAKT